MNYVAHYERLIARSRSRVIVVYTERHHVVPRCMGGSNRAHNIVRLTPEEHYVAHQLLTKMYPKNKALATAATMMAPRCGGRRAYGWLCRRHAEFSRQINTGGTNRIGKRHTEEAKARISATKKAAGVVVALSSEARRKIAASKAGVPRSPETRAKLAEASRGKTLSTAARAKLSAFFKGRKLSEEHRKKIALSKIGGRHSEATRMKIRAAWSRWRAARLAADSEAFGLEVSGR